MGMSAAASGQIFIYEKEPGPGYFEADLGGVITPDFKLTSFAGSGLNGSKASADPGYRFDFLGGCHFARNFAVELDTGVVFNSIDKIGGQTLSPDRLDIWQTPLLVNLVYTIPTEGPVSAYVGAGAGGVFTSIDFRIEGFGHIRDTDATFGYQAFAGVKYAINDWADIGVAYKFMGTANHSWTDEGVDVTSNAILSHAILASFTMHF